MACKREALVQGLQHIRGCASFEAPGSPSIERDGTLGETNNFPGCSLDFSAILNPRSSSPPIFLFVPMPPKSHRSSAPPWWWHTSDRRAPGTQRLLRFVSGAALKFVKSISGVQGQSPSDLMAMPQDIVPKHSTLMHLGILGNKVMYPKMRGHDPFFYGSAGHTSHQVSFRGCSPEPKVDQHFVASKPIGWKTKKKQKSWSQPKRRMLR